MTSLYNEQEVVLRELMGIKHTSSHPYHITYIFASMPKRTIFNACCVRSSFHIKVA